IEDPGVWDRMVTGLYRDRAGALWIGGNAELGRLTEARALTLFRPAEGLPPGQLRAIAEDPQGALWVSAVGGFVRLEGERFVTPPFARRISAVRSMLAARDGSFWLTTVAIEPHRVRANTTAPAVEIESVALDGRPAAPGETFPAGPGQLVVQ